MTRLESALSGVRLWPHHVDTVRRTIAHFEGAHEVQALLLGGSLVHGYAGEHSDVDIVIVVDEAEFARREAVPALTFLSHELATYEGGYVDGKFVSTGFLAAVAARGSDATRWGYDNARILFSRVPELEAVLGEITAFPRAEGRERRTRFAAQLLAWRWYFEQGWEKGDPYLRGVSLNRVVLYACRLILNLNEQLYPFHKWLLRVTADAENRPPQLMDDIQALYADPTLDRVNALVDVTLAHCDIDREAADRDWGAWFVRDTELSWMAGSASVDDL